MLSRTLSPFLAVDISSHTRAACFVPDLVMLALEQLQKHQLSGAWSGLVNRDQFKTSPVRLRLLCARAVTDLAKAAASLAGWRYHMILKAPGSASSRGGQALHLQRPKQFRLDPKDLAMKSQFLRYSAGAPTPAWSSVKRTFQRWLSAP